MNLLQRMSLTLRNASLRLLTSLTAILLSGVATTAYAQISFNLIPGWNLVGNSSGSSIDVAARFGNATKIQTVWKWNSIGAKWAFYTPVMTSVALTAYAQSNGYDVLSSIASKEGFWVNTSEAVTILGPVITTGVTLEHRDLRLGWNLVGSADNKTPSQLHQALTGSLNNAGKAMETAWSWEGAQAQWKFYAPSLEAQGGNALADYIATKQYLPFNNAPVASGGFWLNVAAVPDTTAPTVSSTVAPAGATGVSINTFFTASFSEDMDPLTINSATFKLACPAGTPKTGTVSYMENGHVATFTPASNLPALTLCTATITTGVKDAAGNAIASAFSWTVTTGAAPDTTLPTVSATLPLANATGVGRKNFVFASFSEAINPVTITAATFKLACPAGTATAGGVSYSVLFKLATFTPASKLPKNTTCMVTITTGVKDVAGNALASTFTRNFTTGTKSWTDDDDDDDDDHGND